MIMLRIISKISKEMDQKPKEEEVKEVPVSIDTFLGINKVFAGIIGGFMLFILIIVLLLS